MFGVTSVVASFHLAPSSSYRDPDADARLQQNINDADFCRQKMTIDYETLKQAAETTSREMSKLEKIVTEKQRTVDELTEKKTTLLNDLKDL